MVEAYGPVQLATVASEVAVRLADGLSDTWSQVGPRPAAAARPHSRPRPRSASTPPPTPPHPAPPAGCAPQVRFAACVATRTFLQLLESQDVRAAILPILLGPMCLQR